MIKKSIFFFLLLCFSLYSFSQENKYTELFGGYSFSFDKIAFKGYSNATNSITVLKQTSDRYIWIGTNSGLFRYDGYKIKVFDKSMDNQFKSNLILSLFEDRQGRLWIGTAGGLLIYHKNSEKNLTSVNVLNNHEILSLCEDRNGSMLAGTANGLYQIKDDSVLPVKYFNGNAVNQIIRDSSGNVWFSVIKKGIIKFTGNSYIAVTPPSDERVISLSASNDGSIWSGGSSGTLFRIEAATGTIKANFKLSSLITKIALSGDEVWISTSGSGLFLLKNKTLFRFDKEQGLYNQKLTAVLIDYENNIWAGSIGTGLFKLKKDKFKNLTSANGLSSNFTTTVFEDSKNNLWVGYSSGFLDKIQADKKIISYNYKSGLPDSPVNTLAEDQNGDILVGTSAGLIKISNNEIRTLNDEKLNNSNIRAVYKDSKSNIWVGTSNGLFKSSGTTFTQFNIENGLPGGFINCISEDIDKNILIGTTNGLSAYNGETFLNYSISNGLPDNAINCIYCDQEGAWWIGTPKGLTRIKNGDITNYNSGMLDESVLHIVEHQNILWLSSKKGIFYIRKSDLMVSDRNFLPAIGYNTEDGMTVSECYGISQPGGIKNHEGLIIIPTLYGLSVLDPNHIFSVKTQLQPNIVITDFIVDNENIEMSREIIIRPGKKSFQFDFSALSFTNSEKNQYRYILEGFDDDWKNAGNRTHVEYTNLPPGDYTFRVMGCNSDGVWNVEGASVSFTLKPFFFQSTLFYIFVISFGVLLILAADQYRVSRIERRRKELEKIVEIRTKELVEINTTKDKLFSIISHDLRGSIGNFMSMLRLLVDEPDAVDETDLREILKAMKDSSESTYYLLDNLLNWARSQRGVIEYNPQKTEINYVINDVIGLLKQIAKSKNIRLVSELTEPVTAKFDKNTINTVIRNLTSNALKFTRPNGNVWISAEKGDKYITVSINDNGVGISKENSDKIFKAYQGVTTLGTGGEKGTGLGLMLCQEFVVKNGGKLWVESEIGKGSSFKFTLPVE